MQGRKELTPKMLYQVTLPDLVPADNYYRQLDKAIDVQFLYAATNPGYAQKISRIRSKTVEPVLGTLINFMNMKRVNTRGMAQANKHVLMAAMAYNLKKYLKFIAKKPKSQAQVVPIHQGEAAPCLKTAFLRLERRFLSPLFLNNPNIYAKINLA